MANRFWVGGTGNWSDSTNHWSTSSGGSPSVGNLPTSSDDVFFNTLSNAGDYTCTINSSSSCKTLNLANPSSGTMTLNGSSSLICSGGLSITSTIIWGQTGQLVFNASTGSFNITTNNITITSSIMNFSGAGGTWTLTSNLKITGTFSFIGNGATFDAATYDVDIQEYSGTASGITKYLKLGTGTWTYRGTNFNIQSDVSVDAGRSTIKYVDISNNNAFFGLSQAATRTFYNIWFDRGGSTASITMFGSHIYNDIKDTGTEAHSLLFTHGTTTKTSTFNVNGSSGKKITISSDNTATHNLVKLYGGAVGCNYLDISHSVASPSNRWFAGTTSTDGQGASVAGSGWTFTDPPAVITSPFPSFFQ